MIGLREGRRERKSGGEILAWEAHYMRTTAGFCDRLAHKAALVLDIAGKARLFSAAMNTEFWEV